jgi:hypothetical protein
MLFVISRYVEKHQKEKKVRELNKPKVVNEYCEC